MQMPSRMVRVAGMSLLACALLATTWSATACARRDSTASAPGRAQATRSFLGPYPMGVAVGFGAFGLTLDSVQVSDRERPGPEVSGVGASPPASQGKKYVHAKFVMDGVPKPDPAGYLIDPLLVVDGKVTPLGSVSSMFDGEPPPGIAPRETLSFQVPRNAHSVVLHLNPSFAQTQTVAFTLW